MQNDVALGINDFYSFYTLSVQITKETPESPVIRTCKSSPCSKEMFAQAACDGIKFLIKNIAFVVLSALGVILTCGCKASFKDTFHKNVFEARVHAASIPISFRGTESPQVVNEELLGLNKEVIIEQSVTPKLDQLGQCAYHLGVHGTLPFRLRINLYEKHLKRAAAVATA